MDLGLTGKNALVVASSRGLGRAIAKQLASDGVNVVITSSNEERLLQTKNEIKAETGRDVISVPCDITKVEDIETLFKVIQDKFEKLDILVNNSGGPPGGKFENFTDEDWQEAYELTLLNYIRMTRQALPLMKNSGGHIINIASSSIKQPISGLILSNVFRLGIVGLTKSLAEEFAPYNILINTVAPGSIATERLVHLNQMNAEKEGVTLKEVEDRAQKSIPLGRYGDPVEFARVVAFLVSEANTYMTGSSFYVDGGAVRAI